MQNFIKKKEKFLFNGRFSILIFLLILFSCDKNPQSNFGLKTGKLPELPILDIPNKPQESTNWCWAASLQMVISYLNKVEISQCEIVTKKVFLENPDLDSSLSACNCERGLDGCTFVDNLRSGSQTLFFQSLPQLTFSGDAINANKCGIDPQSNVDVVKKLLKLYNLEGKLIEKSENTLQEIKSHINNKSPIIAFYANSNLVTHLVVINGYQDVNENTYLLINNPLFNQTASCEGCSHLIQTDNRGDNEFSYQMDGEDNDTRPKNGTYCALAYLAVIKLPSAVTN